MEDIWLPSRCRQKCTRLTQVSIFLLTPKRRLFFNLFLFALTNPVFWAENRAETFFVRSQTFPDSTATNASRTTNFQNIILHIKVSTGIQISYTKYLVTGLISIQSN